MSTTKIFNSTSMEYSILGEYYFDTVSETMEAVAKLIEQGKVRYAGAAEIHLSTDELAFMSAELSTLQLVS